MAQQLVPEDHDVPDGLGQGLREAREAQGIGLRTLAKRVGVSPSLISQVERGKVMPSVGTLYAIVRELDLSMDDLFAGAQAIGRRAARDDGGPILHGQTRDTIYLASGVRWERLTAEPEAEMDFQISTYAAGAESCPADALMTHEGKEHGYLISGRLGVTIGDQTYEMGPGDSVSFASTTPHRLFTIGDEAAEAIWLVVGREKDARLVR
jgi:transcriptional regulator with XRE-family HTH domain